MSLAESALREIPRATPEPVQSDTAAAEVRDDARLRRIFDEQFTFVWRYLRRLGLSEADADDAAQQVFMVLSRKLGAVERDKERAFVCGIASRVCSEVRRASARRREVGASEVGEPIDGALRPDAVADQQRARALLDVVLGQMDLSLRQVLVLFELEEMSTVEIAEMLDLPTGTAASRLRRARENFRAIVKRMQAGGQLPGGTK